MPTSTSSTKTSSAETSSAGRTRKGPKEPLRDERLLEVGRIGRVHGLAGALHVQLHWAQSSALLQVKRVVLLSEQGTVEHGVRDARPAGKGVLLTLREVNDRDAALQLRGARVCVLRSDLPPLETGEYYLADLIGFTVLAPDGVVGTVVDLSVYPSVDCLVVQTAEGDRVEQPLVPSYVERVDTAARCVVLGNRDGLLP